MSRPFLYLLVPQPLQTTCISPTLSPSWPSSCPRPRLGKTSPPRQAPAAAEPRTQPGTSQQPRKRRASWSRTNKRPGVPTIRTDSTTLRVSTSTMPKGRFTSFPCSRPDASIEEDGRVQIESSSLETASRPDRSRTRAREEATLSAAPARIRTCYGGKKWEIYHIIILAIKQMRCEVARCT